MRSAAITSLLLLVAVATEGDEKGHLVKFTAYGGRSGTFASLRENKTTVLTSECGKEVTEPLGILEQTYELGSAKNGEVCTWKLHAPVNHVVNVISLIFVLEDELNSNSDDDSVKYTRNETTSSITLYDGREPEEKNILESYEVVHYFNTSHFSRSISSNQDMIVQLKYHDQTDYATQKILVNYEFVEIEKMQELIRKEDEEDLERVKNRSRNPIFRK